MSGLPATCVMAISIYDQFVKISDIDIDFCNIKYSGDIEEGFVQILRCCKQFEEYMSLGYVQRTLDIVC